MLKSRPKGFENIDGTLLYFAVLYYEMKNFNSVCTNFCRLIRLFYIFPKRKISLTFMAFVSCFNILMIKNESQSMDFDHYEAL